MKGISTLLATLCLMQSVHAQTITSAVPGSISYQGRALNSAGTVMGSGTPVNRTVTFRIWDHASNSLTANLIYSEQQVVTIAEGEFSVLVGAGNFTAGTPLGYSESGKGPPTVKISDLSVFAGVNRFLGVTIDDGTVAVDNEVSPRQQIVSSAYALRARYAEQLGSNGGTALTALDSGNVGIGNTSPPSRFTVTAAATGTSTPQMIITADDVTERLRIGVDSTNNGTGFIQAFKEGVGAQNLLLNPNGGNVGIGTTAPVARLDIIDGTTAGSYGSAMITRPTNSHTGSHMAFVRSGAQIMGVGYAPSVNTFGFGQGVSGVAFSPGYLAIDQNNSFVGIGTASPGYKLDVRGNGRFTDTLTTDAPIVMGPGSQIYGTAVAGESKPVFWPRATDDATYLNIGSNGWYVRDDANNVVMRLTSGGKLGLGTSTPANFLQVQAPISAFTATNSVTSGNAIAAIGASDTALHFGTYNNTYGYTSWIQSMRTWDNYAFGLSLNPNGGNVGIGTANPGTKLQIDDGATDSAKYGSLQINRPATDHVGAHMSFVRVGHVATSLGYGQSSNNFGFGPAGVGAFTPSWLLFTAAGNVQIGGTTSNQARLNIGTSSGTYATIGYLDTNGGQAGDTASATHNTSIFADGRIIAPYVGINSDLRIKTDLHPSDSGKDLATLMGIAVTDYQLKDKVAHGKGTQKKVIAQQVETIYPQAVLQTTNVVPDLYKKAAVKNGWVELATDLKKGDRVKLIGKTDQSVHEVLEIRDGAFRTDGKVNDEEVFVYGREVSDFRNVDYDAIAMLNVSATQELARQLKTVQAENAALRRELAAKEESMEARLIALEARLPKDSAPAPVSLKTVSTSK